MLGNAVKVARAGEVVVSVRVAAHAAAPHAVVEVVAGSSVDSEEQRSVSEAIAPANGLASRRPGGPRQ